MHFVGTKTYIHSGTTTPTDIGPSTGGFLYSIVLSPTGRNGIVIREGGSSGNIIVDMASDGSGQIVPIQLRWEGIKVNGQLNIALGTSSMKVTVEMSD